MTDDERGMSDADRQAPSDRFWRLGEEERKNEGKREGLVGWGKMEGVFIEELNGGDLKIN